MITVLRLAVILSHCRIAIQKLNKIIINQLTNLRPSIFPDKQQFDTSQNLDILGDNFDSVSLETIPDTILQALSFYHFPLGYFEKKTLWLVDNMVKPELVIKLMDNYESIIDFKDEKVRKRLEHAVKKKIQCNNCCALVWQAFAPCFVAFLLFDLFIFALLSCFLMPTSLSCPRLPTSLLFCPLILTLLSFFQSTLSSCLLIPILLSFPISVLSSYLFIPTLLSLFMPIFLSSLVSTLLSYFILSLAPTYLIFSAFRTFKQALLDKRLDL